MSMQISQPPIPIYTDINLCLFNGDSQYKKTSSLQIYKKCKSGFHLLQGLLNTEF